MANRTLTFSIFRHDPQAAGSTPHMQEYRLEETPGMSIFIALNRLREEQDPTLQFDFVCRAGICGSCAMVINGKPTLACRTLTATFASPHITLLPLPGFELIGDLSVNTGKFMRALSERIGAWLHPKADSVDIHSVEAPMSPDLPTNCTKWNAASSAGAALPVVQPPRCVTPLWARSVSTRWPVLPWTTAMPVHSTIFTTSSATKTACSAACR